MYVCVWPCACTCTDACVGVCVCVRQRERARQNIRLSCTLCSHRSIPSALYTRCSNQHKLYQIDWWK